MTVQVRSSAAVTINVSEQRGLCNVPHLLRTRLLAGLCRSSIYYLIISPLFESLSYDGQTLYRLVYTIDYTDISFNLPSIF